jgi:hypothetical protein
MQQFLSSEEACVLLDTVLRTAQGLRRAFEAHGFLGTVAVDQADTTPSKPPLEPPVAPVLTIPLAALQREGELARRRRNQRSGRVNVPRRAPPRSRTPTEVIYRRGFKLVS